MPDWVGDTSTQTIVLVVTAVVYDVILYYTRRGAQGAALIRVLELVQGDEIRMARKRLYLEATGSPDDWTPDLRSDVEKVCQIYGTVGTLMKARLIPRSAFFRYSGKTVVRSHDSAKGFLDWRAAKFAEKPWDNFVWLAQEARDSRHWDKSAQGLHQTWLAQRAVTQLTADGANAD